MAQQEKSAESSIAAGEIAAEAALVKATASLADTRILAVNALAARLPIEVDVAVPVRKFRVRNLLALEKGTVVESLWLPGEDLPLAARGAQLAWSEFEVIDRKLAVRITRLV